MRPRSAETSEPACTKRKMLSMKSSTFAPSSRKYSAIVRPVSATRRRAPGGSFICPKTSAVSLSTPDSLISIQRSLPSRVRSPTPANTELPWCSRATLRISSWIRTVLPRPAPPNSPTLPPRTNGATRSITLMPVSKISIVGCSASKDGGSRWMGQRSPSSAIGSPSSIGSPRTLKGRAGVDHVDPARNAVGRVHRDRADAVVAEVLLHLRDQRDRGLAVALRELDAQGAVDLGQLVREHGVDDDTLDLDDLADVLILAVVLVRHVSPGEAVRVTCPGRGETACPGFGVYRSAAALDPAWETPFRPLSARPPGPRDR